MRPGSAASLPVSITSTGLLCLSVGARVHRGRSITEVERVAATMYISHPVHDICIWRCDGPERHEMLIIINACYGYCGILQVCQILH